MHPEFEGFGTEMKRLREHGIKGIKIHPAYQETDLNDIKFKRIIAAAEENDMIDDFLAEDAADNDAADLDTAEIDEDGLEESFRSMQDEDPDLDIREDE